MFNPLAETGTYGSHDCQLLCDYDVTTTFLKSIIFPLLPTIMELFQICQLKSYDP